MDPEETGTDLGVQRRKVQGPGVQRRKVRGPWSAKTEGARTLECKDGRCRAPTLFPEKLQLQNVEGVYKGEEGTSLNAPSVIIKNAMSLETLNAVTNSGS
jgi:hypothetical protein